MTDMKSRINPLGAISGAAFLMATSAIGPGFINNTSLFTGKLGADFGFIILAALMLDIIIQLLVWLTIGMKGRYAQQIANDMLPGSGTLLAILIAMGGFVFNMGNLAGCVLGMQLLFHIPEIYAVLISILVAFAVLFSEKRNVLDGFSIILGVIMIGLMLFTVCKLSVPIELALQRTFIPEKTDPAILITIIGGTVGGYISFAGAHHLIDNGIKGKGKLKEIGKSAARGIIITSLMRYLLFLAAFAVVYTGTSLSATNPASTIFFEAAGNAGTLIFGLVLWSAAITSVIGSSYTSYSFVKTIHPRLTTNPKWFISLFIIGSAAILIWMGKPVKLLVIAGAFNGIILPLALIILLAIIHKNRKHADWKMLKWLSLPGWIITVILTYMSYEGFKLLFQ
jgi:Mn2+/Fe2+ NRAMP family transporter